jgi:hypothetical protein
MRHHLLGEQARAVSRLFVGLVARVQQTEDAQGLDQFLHPLADGLRAAGDDHAAVDERLPGRSRQLGLGLALQSLQRGRFDGVDRAVAGRVLEGLADVETTIEEVQDVVFVQTFGFASVSATAMIWAKAARWGEASLPRAATRSQ